MAHQANSVSEQDVRAMLRLAVELADLPPDRNLRERRVREAMGDLCGGDQSRQHLSHLFVTETASLIDPASDADHADLRRDALSPRLRQVLHGLLAGQSEKQVALDLGISPHIVNGYVKVLYRHFGVCSRGELMAHFVRN